MAPIIYEGDTTQRAQMAMVTKVSWISSDKRGIEEPDPIILASREGRGHRVVKQKGKTLQTTSPAVDVLLPRGGGVRSRPVQDDTGCNYRLSPWIRRKYDVQRVVCYHFAGKKTLEDLRRHYKTARCEPFFLHQFLDLAPCIHRRLAWERSELYDWNTAGDWVTMPSPQYCDTDQVSRDPMSAKDNPEGFGLIGWFVHPHRLAQSVFADSSVRNEPGAMVATIEKRLGPGEDLELGFGSPEPPIEKTAERNATVDEITDNPDSYLATILDLNASHIPWLEDIKERTLAHLQTVYDVDPTRDRVLLYFHFPYVEMTATLHLHVRVNQGIHPTEQLKAFHLDEILDALRNGQGVADVVMGRQRLQNGIVASPGAAAVIAGVKGASSEWIDNPYGAATHHGVDVALGNSGAPM